MPSKMWGTNGITNSVWSSVLSTSEKIHRERFYIIYTDLGKENSLEEEKGIFERKFEPPLVCRLRP